MQVFDWLRSLRTSPLLSSGAARGRRKRALRPRRRPHAVAASVQSLEPRVLLAANPVGPEFRVNTFAPGDQTTREFDPTRNSAMDANGNFVVVWNSSEQDAEGDQAGVYGQLFNADGTKRGGEFHISTFTTSIQQNPSVAMDATGNFVVAWEGWMQESGGIQIYAQRYAANGTALGGEFRVNTTTFGNHNSVDVAMDADGDFAIVWAVQAFGIVGRKFAANGTPITGEITINSSADSGQALPKIAMDAEGDFVVAWTSRQAGDDSDGIYARRFDATGTALANEFHVNTATTASQASVNIGMNAAGEFAIAWISTHEDSFGDVFASTYAADGTVRLADLRVKNLVNTFQRQPSIALDAAGNFVVAFYTFEGDPDLHLKQFSASGTQLGPETQINTYGTSHQVGPTVAMNGDGDFVVTWHSWGEDSNTKGVYGQRYTTNLAPTGITLTPAAVDEGRPSGTTVGTLLASDPNTNEQFTYELVGGTGGEGNNSFMISGNQLLTAAIFDYETQTSYSIRVKATDRRGMSTTRVLTVQVNNLNDAPVITLINKRASLSESTSMAVRRSIADIMVTDDTLGTYSFVLGGSDSAAFEIIGTTLFLRAGTTLDFETHPTFHVTVSVDDASIGSGVDSTDTHTLTITDANEPPAVSLTNLITSLAEDASVATSRRVADIEVTNDALGVANLSLSGSDAGLFEIVGNSLFLRAGATLDFETNPTLDVSVDVDDPALGATPEGSAAYSLSLTDVNDAPQIVLTSPVTALSERASTTTRTLVAGIQVTDDALGSHPLTLSGADAAMFEIVGDQLFLRAGAWLDFETNPVLDVTVNADDPTLPGTPDASAALSIPITNIVENPPVVTKFDMAMKFTENGPPIVLAAGAMLTDADSPNFFHGNLVLDITQNAAATDQLGIRNQGAGTGRINVSGTDVTFGGVVIGTVTGLNTNTLTVTFTPNASFAAVQMLIQNLTFANTSDTPSTAVRTVRLRLLGGDSMPSAPVLKSVSVAAANDIPVVGGLSGTETFVEAGNPILVAATGTVTDPDLLDFNMGVLTVRFAANGNANDRFAVRNEGIGAGQVGVSGTNITFGGTIVGKVAGGTGTTALMVTFNASANAAVVEAVLKNITFANLSTNPSVAPRTLQVTLTDGDGGTSAIASKSIVIQPVNTQAAITALGGDVTYLKLAAPALVSAMAMVADPDSVNFNSGILRAELTANADTNDVLAIRNDGTGAGKIGVSNGNLTLGGVVIGTVTGGNGANALVITFTSNLVTPAVAQAVLRNLTFTAGASMPSVLPRTLSVTLDDGDDAVSTPVTKTINVALNTVITGWDGTITYTENAANTPMLLESGVMITDPDSANFAGHVLTVSTVQGGEAADILAIKNQGVAAGKIGVNGSDVTFGGIVMGTFTGGDGTNPLVISLNAAATKTAVQMLIQSLTFSNTSRNPSTVTRSVRLVMTDAEGTPSTAVAKGVIVKGVNNAPTIDGFTGAIPSLRSGPAVQVGAAATVADVDSADFNTGRLTVQLSNGAQALDRLTIRNEGTGAGQIGVSGNTVTYGGVAIGTFSGGSGITALTVVLNANANAEAVQALLRNILFSTTSTSNVVRTVKATLTDGDGGTSNMPTATINVS